MNIVNFKREWDFVIREINASNKGGTDKGRLLFEFQILLSVSSRTKNLKERQMLTSIYQERKERYESRA